MSGKITKQFRQEKTLSVLSTTFDFYQNFSFHGSWFLGAWYMGRRKENQIVNIIVRETLIFTLSILIALVSSLETMGWYEEEKQDLLRPYLLIHTLLPGEFIRKCCPEENTIYPTTRIRNSSSSCSSPHYDKLPFKESILPDKLSLNESISGSHPHAENIYLKMLQQRWILTKFKKA